MFVGLPPGGRWLRPGDFRPVGVAQPGDEGSTCDDNQVVLGRGQRGGGGSVGAEGCLYATRALIYRQAPETQELINFSLFDNISEIKYQYFNSQSHSSNDFSSYDCCPSGLAQSIPADGLYNAWRNITTHKSNKDSEKICSLFKRKNCQMTSNSAQGPGKNYSCTVRHRKSFS